jgi:hypothetical protein
MRSGVTSHDSKTTSRRRWAIGRHKTQPSIINNFKTSNSAVGYHDVISLERKEAADKTEIRIYSFGVGTVEFVISLFAVRAIIIAHDKCVSLVEQ